MKSSDHSNGWLKIVIAIMLLGFILNFPGMKGIRPVRVRAAGTQPLAAGFSWEYQLDFNATSLQSAKQQASSLIPGLKSLGVASELQPLGEAMYRLRLTGDQGMEQVRQVVFSSLLAGFIGGAAEVEVDMPVGSLLDTTFKLVNNLSTGYGWEVIPSTGVSFTQTGEPTFTTRSRGYGVPSVETLVLHSQVMGNGIIKLVYRRPFEPDEAFTRHLRITLGEQALQIDLSDPHPQVIITPTEPGVLPLTTNSIAEIPIKGTLPVSWDWRTSGIVPAVRNQGGCGGCWSFGTVGVMESAIAKAGGPMTDLSEQFLISCNTSGWSCSGGLTAHFWHYDTLGKNQTNIGAVLEADKPYTASNGTCTVAYNHPYKLSGWQFIVSNEFTMPTNEQIKNAIYTYGPVTAGVCADNGWNSYTGGIYNPRSNVCGGSTNHQIILVGWDDTTSSWILRNSWGSSWGENGYMRIRWDPGGTTSRVGEGTSWVAWTAPGPAPFGKSSPANTSFGQPANPSLTWDTSSAATSYEYCIDTSDNNACNATWISTSASTSVTLSGLANGTYFWQARAKNTIGTTDASAGTWWSFTVGQGFQIFMPLALHDYAATVPSIINGDFESGSTAWTKSSSHGSSIIVNAFPSGVTAHSGSYAAWLGGANNDTSYVQQQVTISAGNPYLVYWHWIASSETDCTYDFGKDLVNNSIVDTYALCQSNGTGGWVKHSVNLSAYAGQSVTLQIRAETDSSINSNLFVDDGTLQANP